ncbi:MAG: HAD-IIB family hydrolase [Candidatus Gracilibacteria bacterium]
MKKQQIRQKFLAAMFDFDGTLTERTPRSPVPDSLKKTLENLSKTVLLALCTARPFKTALPKMETTFGEKFAKMGWILIVENGCAGFELKKNKWVEFYRVKWPEKSINKAKLTRTIKTELKEFIGHNGEDFQYNESSLIMQPSYENTDNSGNASNDEIARRCDVLEKGIKGILKKFAGANKIKVKNSKLGIIIIPKIADKDTGIEKFGEYLKKNRKMKFSAKYREIITVGDQPEKGGNDEMFLNGRIGTPFTAGEILKSKKYPFGVYKNKKRLIGPSATEHLLKTVKFC